MDRRFLLGLRAVVVIALVVAYPSSQASGQSRESMSRVGMLTPAPSATAKPAWDAFREAMKELGYVEGKSVVYEYRSAEGQLLARADEIIQ
jgi:ABC-type sugar transport system substrate-binding protein